jgi:hypothetical protein
MQGEPQFSRAFQVELETAFHVPSLNTFDVQHFERIHNRHFTKPPQLNSHNRWHLQIEYEAEIIKRRWSDHLLSWVSSPKTHLVIDCWGSSLLLLHNLKTGVGGMVTMLPIEHDRCRVFLLAIKTEADRKSIIGRWLDSMTLRLGVILIWGFLHPDIKPLTNMRPYPGDLIDGLDDTVKHFFDYWQRLPRWNGPPAS